MIKVEVIFMLHNEARHLIIQALNHHTPVKEIAECFSVNTSTIYRFEYSGPKWTTVRSKSTAIK